jgi:hypothetical protein
MSFGALGSFRLTVFLRRGLAVSPLALERLFIVCPVGSDAGIVAGRRRTLEVAYSCSSNKPL